MALATTGSASKALATPSSLEGYMKEIAAYRRKGDIFLSGALTLPYDSYPATPAKQPENRSAFKENNKYMMRFPGGEFQPDVVKEIIITKPMKNQYTRMGQCGNWKTGASSWTAGY
mmetsp:Transcript_18116/g.37003  ORF Transcript_18116/g.37003 Transcript_18116/m.37003 type:complete len:116 (-) Transcript_18116:250-597(-)|eukprot:CAMPEP_0113820022 /NCGR_PEP_ID=MMETSP0328-20130328/1031_1 /TAXON_ID=39455 /ORGANISM="Alexandrium minutum" /LENGTH=115 /DNA_ID=CAMNT_0000787955 /DNA_START=99 /DNA_END=446 /DNA_ORIENTATION=+ /assembly_acc=CAM_ASM_000350